MRYTYSNPSVAKFQFAVEDPSDGAHSPNLIARIDKGYDWGSMSARVLSHEQRMGGVSKRGMGFGLSGSYKLTGTTTLMAQYTLMDGETMAPTWWAPTTLWSMAARCAWTGPRA